MAAPGKQDAEASTEAEARLNAALDRGASPELPPHAPAGFLGERGLNVGRTEEYRPTLTAGIVQESTWETRWLTIAVLYFLIITGPVAAWLLWRDRRRSLRAKIIVTLAGAVGYAVLYFAYSRPAA